MSDGDGQTIVEYGDVTLFRCLTRRVEQRPVYDPTGTQLKNWKFVVSGQGYLHGYPSSCLYESTVGHTTDPNIPDRAAKAHKQSRWRLTPRKKFRMAVGCTSSDITTGDIILAAMPMAGNVTYPSDLTFGLTNNTAGTYIGYDVDDGPRCLQFDIVHVAADNVFRVEYAFEINRVQCDDDDKALGNTNGVLSHRWSCADSIDENLRTTRSYRGLLEIATSEFSPHWFRDLVVPPLQEGMQREQMDFVASEDGKKLQYQITDRSVSLSAPYPAQSWSIEHTEASVMHDGIKQTSQCSVKLTGAEDVDKGQLIILGLYVVSAKLKGSPPGNAPARPFMMNDITITDYSGPGNAVAVSASGWRLPGELKAPGGAVAGIQLNADGFNKIIAVADLPAFSAPYNSKQSAGGRNGEEPPYSGPVALIGIFRCYLQEPCSSGTGIATHQISDRNTATASTPVTSISAEITPSITVTDPPYYSDSHKANLYTFWQMESVYKTNKQRAAMPIAKPATYSGGGFDTSNSCSIVGLSRPQCRRTVRIHAERVGSWPEFPSSESMVYAVGSGSGTTLGQKPLSQKLLAGTVTKSCNGEDIYRASMQIEFALLREPDPSELLNIGQNKWSASAATVSNATLTGSSNV